MQESQIRRIFSTMINQKLEVFREEVKPLGEILALATLDLYFSVSAHFLPTPSKIHYLFNLRDISKVRTRTPAAALRTGPDLFLFFLLRVFRCSRVCSELIQTIMKANWTSPDYGFMNVSGDCGWERDSDSCVCAGNSAHLSLLSGSRVFSDRLVDHKDLEEYVALLEKTLTSHFDLQFDSICPEKQTPIFG